MRMARKASPRHASPRALSAPELGAPPARGRLYRHAPGGITDPLVATCWRLACFLGRRGERLRLDLTQPAAVRSVRSDRLWGAYWSGFDRAEIAYRQRRSLEITDPVSPQILLGRDSGAMSSCRRAARRLVRGAPLDDADLLALLTLLHEMHHAVSASGLSGYDYALFYRHAWQLEEGFVHAISAARLEDFIREQQIPIIPGALESVLELCATHELAEHARAVVAACQRLGGLEEGWRRFLDASLLGRMFFLASAPQAPTALEPTRENREAKAA